jgi:hypothetical protein
VRPEPLAFKAQSVLRDRRVLPEQPARRDRQALKAKQAFKD